MTDQIEHDEALIAKAKAWGRKNERTRIITYLVERGVIRRDAFGYLVTDTVDDYAIDLPGLEENDEDFVQGEFIKINTKEIGAMLARAAEIKKDQLRLRLLALREVSPAGSPVSIEISKWVRELD